MKEFSWKYFCSTGQIDAYLLYKDFDTLLNEKNKILTEGDGYIN